MLIYKKIIKSLPWEVKQDQLQSYTIFVQIPIPSRHHHYFFLPAVGFMEDFFFFKISPIVNSLLEHKVGRVCLCSTQNQCPVTTSVCMCVELTMAVSTKLNLTRLLVNLRTVPKFRKKILLSQLAAASKSILKIEDDIKKICLSDKTLFTKFLKSIDSTLVGVTPQLSSDLSS